MKRIRIIRGYAAHSRWLQELDDGIVAWLARGQVEEIKTPYRYSPSIGIMRWNGRNIIAMETGHRVIEVFEVPANLLRFKTDAEATEWNCRFCRKAS